MHPHFRSISSLNQKCKQSFSSVLARQNSKSFYHQEQSSLHMFKMLDAHFNVLNKIHASCFFVYLMNRMAIKNQVGSQKEKAWRRLLKIMCQNLSKLINVPILLSAHPSYPLTDEQTVR